MTSTRKVIYFCGSKFGGRQDEVLYNILFKKLDRYGDVIQPFDPEKGINQLGSRREHRLSMHDRDVALLTMCDVMVAEVTHPSLGVGYEIGRAVELGKPVLCLFRPPRSGGTLRGMLRGMDNKDHLRVYDYDPEHVDMIFQDFIPKYINFKVPKEEEEEPSQPQVSRQTQGPPGLGIENLTKSQLKNKKRREVSKNKAAASEVDGGNKNAPPRQLAEEVNVLSDQERKKIRILSNKLESIQKIKQQQAEGKPLEQNQIEKLSREQDILDELNALKLSSN